MAGKPREDGYIRKQAHVPHRIKKQEPDRTQADCEAWTGLYDDGFSFCLSVNLRFGGYSEAMCDVLGKRGDVYHILNGSVAMSDSD